jgi:hypothetical protein
MTAATKTAMIKATELCIVDPAAMIAIANNAIIPRKKKV